jgi:hypothetical protein
MGETGTIGRNDDVMYRGQVHGSSVSEALTLPSLGLHMYFVIVSILWRHVVRPRFLCLSRDKRKTANIRNEEAYIEHWH